jgi:hypothetical protein
MWRRFNKYDLKPKLMAIWALVNLGGMSLYLWLASPYWPYYKYGQYSSTDDIYWMFTGLPILVIFFLGNGVVATLTVYCLRRKGLAAVAFYVIFATTWIGTLLIDNWNGL